jgi:DNA-binding transcriptional LysR family regulator
MAKANIRQIEAFNAVMKVGSVTKAAETLFVSQPAVTKLLKSFEESCGFDLFSRSTGRLVPTPEA